LASAATEQGAEFRTGARVTRWQESNRIFTVELSGQGNGGENGAPSRIEARALLLACGRHVAKALLPRAAKGDRRQQLYTRNVGIKRHYTGLDMPAQVEIYLIPGGYVGVNPVENGAANVCVLASYDAFARANRSPAGLIAAAVGWNPAFAERIRDGKSVPGTECTVGAVDTRRRAAAWDGVPLLGDTAAMIPPLFGDGMAMALRSADLCAPLVGGYLRGEVSWREMGYHYRHLWHGEFDRRLRMGRLLERALLRRTTTKLLLQAGEKLPSLAGYFVRATRGAPDQAEIPRLQWPDSRLDR
jgi:flavin-dependent dehydrogenase